MSDFIIGRGYAAFGTRLRRLSERIDREVSELYRSRHAEFEPRWFPVVLALDEAGPTSVGDLATRLGVTHAAVSQVRSALVAEGLIDSRQDDADQRRQVLALSRKGRAAVSKLKPLWAAIAQATERLCADAAPELLDNLARLEAALDRQALPDRVDEMLGVVETPAQ